MHQTYGPRLELLIYPSDEFGGQELPEGQVPDFCESKGVPTNAPGCHLMRKTNVNGPSANAVWAFAKTTFPGEIKWNFAGIFLFDKAGGVVSRHSIKAPPSVEQIGKLL